MRHEKKGIAVSVLLRSMRRLSHSPILWGGLAALGFYGLIHGEVLADPFYQRYFTSHWCLYLETILFWIGVAALVLKGFDVAAQVALSQRPLLPEPAPHGDVAADSDALLERLAALPRTWQETYLVRRLRAALLHVRRRGSADRLDEELRNLSDLDAGRMHDSYGLAKIVLWAIPILGFLGTVIGITMAIAEFSPKEFERSIAAMTANLNVAFDTTALALTLNIPLMFGMFYLKQYEGRLLESVDARVDAELAGRFQQFGTRSDPHVSSVRQMSERVLAAVERLVQRQVDLWQSTIGDAHAQWSRLSSSTATQAQEALAAALEQSLKTFAGQLAAAERGATEQNRRNWELVHQALTRSAEATLSQQQELARQGEVLLKVVDATGQVQKLEDELNRNLSLLAGARHFEDTITTLAAAVQLLCARLGKSAAELPAIELGGRGKGKAA